MQALADLASVGDSKLADFDSPHYQPRVEAKANLIHNAKYMVEKHGRSRRVQTYKLGDLVGVLVPLIDRERSSVTNFAGIVVEVTKKAYRVRYRSTAATPTNSCFSQVEAGPFAGPVDGGRSGDTTGAHSRVSTAAEAPRQEMGTSALQVHCSGVTL